MTTETTTIPLLVAYVRVSTRRQGESGLGLEAQRAAVEAYARQTGTQILGWYQEVETGKRSDRPQLLKALAHARRARARLVIAKLDRLARNVAFLSALMESGLDFVACDMPSANRLLLHVMAAFAEEEARAISARTKAGLAAAKARGRLLGAANPAWRAAQAADYEQAWTAAAARGRLRAARDRRRRAIEGLGDLRAVLVEKRDSGASLNAIAAHLNGLGHRAPRGGLWDARAVYRALNLLKRVEKGPAT